MDCGQAEVELEVDCQRDVVAIQHWNYRAAERQEKGQRCPFFALGEEGKATGLLLWKTRP